MQVYEKRKSLALTLKDSQTVVAQVERAVYVTLLIILAFVALAIFDTNSLQRTWTGLSASLISFSFIFGNSIRQVCCASPCSGC
jgi:inner membrane protein involved in colicin E2 resistance